MWCRRRRSRSRTTRRRTRRRWSWCARTSCGRCAPGTTGRGRRTRGSSRRSGRCSRDTSEGGRTRSTRRLATPPVPASPSRRRTCSSRRAGAHGGGPAPQHARRRAVRRGVAIRVGLRAAVQPDGGRRHRGDQPGAELAVAPARRGAGRRRRGGPGHARAAGARRGGGDGEGGGRGGRREVPARPVRGGRQDLQPAVHRAGAGRLPHARRVQPHRGAPPRSIVAVQALRA